jgi:hypothetical protein
MSDLKSVYEWIKILPLGQVVIEDYREAFYVGRESLDIMVKNFYCQGHDLVIGYESTSEPAAGWIKDLEARSDGLWARVNWTQQAWEYLTQREYRYLSPIMRLDPETRRPTALIHVGLTVKKQCVSKANAMLLVDMTMRSGKITEAQKDWALAYCLRDQKSFETFIEQTPVVNQLNWPGTEIWCDDDGRFKEVKPCCIYWSERISDKYRLIPSGTLLRVPTVMRDFIWDLPLFRCPNCGERPRVLIKTPAEILGL